MENAAYQRLQLPCHDVEAELRFFVDTLGFRVREQSDEFAEISSSGTTIELSAVVGAECTPVEEPMHLNLDIRMLDAAWQRTRRLSDANAPPPQLQPDRTYLYETLSPSGHPMALHAEMYRGNRPARSRGKTRRMRPSDTKQDVPSET